MGAALFCAPAGKANSAQASRIGGRNLRDTRSPLNNTCMTAKPASVFTFRHALCRIAPFRRYHVSEVCRWGGFLLAFAALEKCRRDDRRLAAGRCFLKRNL